MSTSQEKNKGGRPRKTMEMLVQRGYISQNWEEDILQMGREGKALVHVLNYLNVSWDTFYRLQERDRKFLETINTFKKLSEQWWIDIVQNEWINGNSKSINSNHWSIVMRNMFKERWSDRKEVDLTSKGDKISGDNTLQIEIIKKVTEQPDDENKEQG
jgi:hypothetical protein